MNPAFLPLESTVLRTAQPVSMRRPRRSLGRLVARAPIWLAAVPLMAFSLMAYAASQGARLGVWSHAFAEYGDVKYSKGFEHFDFVNPDAPKGGTLRLSNPDRRTSFDKYNPFTLPASSPAGVELFMFETLAYPSPDELATMYGLVANEMLTAPDFSSITFRIDPRARFNNGDAVTAADVKYSFDMAVSDKAAPSYSGHFAGVRQAVVLDGRTIRFDLKTPSRDQIYRLGTQLCVFSAKWGLDRDGKPKPFDQIIHDEPITTGPYRIYKASARTLDLVRDPNYWAQDLGVRKGFYNFDHLIYHYFIDNAARFEAFKAGDFDILREMRPRRWVRLYTGGRFEDGRITKARLRDGMGFFYEGFVFNSRRPQLQDRRVREALVFAFDWTWSSKQAFDLDERYDGLFQNTIFAASGLPGPGELKLLEPFRKDLPAAVFGRLPENPRDDTPQALRQNLLHARALLTEAGWTIGADGLLRNARGESFELEVLDADLEFAPIVGRWAEDLKKLGITVRQRVVDFAIYEKRIEAFDFDVTLLNLGNVMLPSASVLADWFGSAAAKTEGSNNVMGVSHPAVDHAIEAIGKASSLEEVADAARVLDRIFVTGYYAVPYIYRPFHMVAYWNKFGMPRTSPKYYTIEDGIDSMPWPIATWWMKSPDGT